MGAMLVGMTTGLVAMGVIFVSKIIIAIVMFIVARFQKMKAFKWAIAGFLLDFWAVAAYIIVKIAASRRKCKACGNRIENIDGYCPYCGEMITKVNDGKIALKFVLFFYVALYGLAAVGGIAIAIISIFQEKVVFFA